MHRQSRAKIRGALGGGWDRIEVFELRLGIIDEDIL